MIGPAQALRDAGCEVAFEARHDLTEQLSRAGLGTFLGGRDRGPAPEGNRGALFAERVRDPVWLRTWIRGLLVDAPEAEVEPLRAVLRAFRPSVVALDPLRYAAVLAAEREGVPWAALSNSLNPVLPEGLDSELLATVRALAPARDALFARHGARGAFRGCDALSPWLTVAFTTPTFVGREVPGVRQVGPSLPRGPRGDEAPFPWESLRPERPLVYVSFGSQVYHQPGLFRLVLEAVRGRPVDLALSVSELLGTDALGPLPPNAVAVRYTPQLQVLARASALVTHGGANAVMEALSFGVPMLVSPLCNDQHHNAFFVERAGVGVTLDPGLATPEAVWGALSTLLWDPGVRARAARVRESYRVDGAAECARLLTALAGGTLPAPG
ncbi:MAG: glycosyltransferase [Deltaproteobacteria bacterium]|nr:glycosyltransferase [Deltaproteobacteria bacterium]